MGGPEEEIAASQPAQLIQKRVASLSSELENTINHYRRLAKETYRLNAALMVLTVGFSLVGGIAGLSEVIGAKLAGMLALLPGLLAVFSTTMRFQAKANQHYPAKMLSKSLGTAFYTNCRSRQLRPILRPSRKSGAS